VKLNVEKSNEENYTVRVYCFCFKLIKKSYAFESFESISAFSFFQSASASTKCNRQGYLEQGCCKTLLYVQFVYCVQIKPQVVSM